MLQLQEASLYICACFNFINNWHSFELKLTIISFSIAQQTPYWLRYGHLFLGKQLIVTLYKLKYKRYKEIKIHCNVAVRSHGDLCLGKECSKRTDRVMVSTEVEVNEERSIRMRWDYMIYKILFIIYFKRNIFNSKYSFSLFMYPQNFQL